MFLGSLCSPDLGFAVENQSQFLPGRELNYNDMYDDLSEDDKELVRQKSMNLGPAGPRNPDFLIYIDGVHL